MRQDHNVLKFWKLVQLVQLVQCVIVNKEYLQKQEKEKQLLLPSKHKSIDYDG